MSPSFWMELSSLLISYWTMVHEQKFSSWYVFIHLLFPLIAQDTSTENYMYSIAV